MLLVSSRYGLYCVVGIAWTTELIEKGSNEAGSGVVPLDETCGTCQILD
jgi:hypothetical protein